jgi:hypothetical protein
MLRIEKTEANGICTVRLEGKLLSPWLPEFVALFEDGAPLGATHLNLKDVEFVDAASLKVLTALRRRGLRIVACSAFVTKLLDQSSFKETP